MLIKLYVQSGQRWEPSLLTWVKRSPNRNTILQTELGPVVVQSVRDYRANGGTLSAYVRKVA